jgi:radical SAM superfamily enzyme YgiQ (UPF0313 family)
MYKSMKFEVREMEEIREDIRLAGTLYPQNVAAVFIGDSDSLVVREYKWVEILNLLYTFFPRLNRVTSYARAKTLVKKSTKELERLRRAGLTRLHVGLETGDQELLQEIRKGATAEEMVEAGRKAKDTGFEYSLYVLLGIGGEARSDQHVRGTDDVLNLINPHFIRVRTFIPQPGSPLYEAILEGRFQSPPAEAILRETRWLLEELDVASQFLSDHVSNLLPLHGRLPEDKERMIQLIDESIQLFTENAHVREEMEARRHSHTCRRKIGVMEGWSQGMMQQYPTFFSL